MSEALRPGRIALVTGAAGGIGAALARALHARGMRVVVSDIAAEPLEAVAAELGAPAALCDVGNAAEVDRLARRVADMDAPIGAVFANAGVMKTAALEDTSPADWAFILSVNLLGVANMIRAFVPLMKAEPTPSRFVATASVAGLVSAPLSGAYNASKHGVVSLCETLHQELRHRHPNVGVSVICPGAVRTDILRMDRYGLAPGDPRAHAAMARAMAATGIDADELAVRSLAQLDEEKFWIFPQDYVFERFRARCEAILNQSDPEWAPKS